MKKIVILFFCFVFLLSACGRNDLYETVKTEFNDEINIHASLRGNLHGRYLYCEITAKNVDGSAGFYGEEMLQIPENIGDNIMPVIMQNDVRIYELYNVLIIINGSKIEEIPIDYDLDYFLSQVSYNGVKADVVCAGISVLCHTKKFEYISQFLPILQYIDPNDSISKVIDRWAMNDFTDEELQINKDFTKEEMSDWCKNYLNQG